MYLFDLNIPPPDILNIILKDIPHDVLKEHSVEIEAVKALYGQTDFSVMNIPEID